MITLRPDPTTERVPKPLRRPGLVGPTTCTGPGRDGLNWTHQHGRCDEVDVARAPVSRWLEDNIGLMRAIGIVVATVVDRDRDRHDYSARSKRSPRE